MVGGQAFEGGAIYNAGVLVTDSSLFVGNQAHVGMGGGGAVYNDGDAAFNRSLFTQNESSYVGGAISSAGTLRMADSVVAGNTASRGGGIAELEGAALELSGSIVAGNQAASDSLGHDIATMQRGVEGTMSSPLTSYSGQLSDVEAWFEPLAAVLPDVNL